jgi:hypothetical protein
MRDSEFRHGGSTPPFAANLRKSYMRRLIVLVGLVVGLFLPATAGAQQVIYDPFTGPDGIIASQSCFFGSGCTDPIWAGGDSGVLRRKSNQGYVAGDQYFRSWTKRKEFATQGRYIEIQRKNRGQDNYTILAFKGNYTAPLNVWQTWSASLVENPGAAGCADDSIRLTLSINGVQQLAATDSGCAAVMMSESEGAVVGLRSDNTVWKLDDFTVNKI